MMILIDGGSFSHQLASQQFALSEYLTLDVFLDTVAM